MWKSVTKSVSNVDANGSVTIIVDILDGDDVVRCPDTAFSGNASSIKDAITERIQNLKDADKIVKTDPLFTIGQSFEVN